MKGPLNMVVINSGVGNVGAIPNMLRRLGAKAHIIHDPEIVGKANCVIIPGARSYDSNMRYLEQTGLKAVLGQEVFSEEVATLGKSQRFGLYTETEVLPNELIIFLKLGAPSPLVLAHFGPFQGIDLASLGGIIYDAMYKSV